MEVASSLGANLLPPLGPLSHDTISATRSDAAGLAIRAGQVAWITDGFAGLRAGSVAHLSSDELQVVVVVVVLAALIGRLLLHFELEHWQISSGAAECNLQPAGRCLEADSEVGWGSPAATCCLQVFRQLAGIDLGLAPLLLLSLVAVVETQLIAPQAHLLPLAITLASFLQLQLVEGPPLEWLRLEMLRAASSRSSHFELGSCRWWSQRRSDWPRLCW